MSDMKLITFEPLDSLFFREAKPFNAGEGGFLDSQFPPPAQTLSGAIRGAIGAATDIDWKNKGAVEKTVGAPGDDPSPLSFGGPYIFKDNRRLYPVPLNLLYCDKTEEWVRLVPSDKKFVTDMGNRRLPEPARQLADSKPVEEGWLDEADMQRVLNGDLPTSLITAIDIFVREARVGIGRDNKAGVVNKGQLYFTRHLRLRQDVSLGMALGGSELPQNGVMRLGGEGRLVRYGIDQMPPSLAAPTATGAEQGLILTLLTHGDFQGVTEPDWSDELPNLELITACVGKAVREGGWEFAKNEPKPLKALVPAGSCFFVKVKNSTPDEMIKQLHGTNIGHRKAFGYGEIAVGLWK